MAKGSLLLLALLVAGVAPANAAHPGANGNIAFVRTLVAFGGYEPSAIWTVRSDGSGDRRLTRPRWGDDDPAWSPDGRRIAFVRQFAESSVFPYAGSELMVMNADGSDERRLTRNAVADSSPTWSRDGRRLFFVRSDPRRSLLERPTSDVWALTLNGLHTRRVARTPELELEVDASSRNQLAYLVAWPVRALNEVESVGYWQIPDERQLWTMRSDGRNRVWSGVTSATFRPVGALGDSLSDPTWTPNGERIAVSSWGNVFSLRRDGEFIIRHGHGSDAAWSPDGRELAIARGGDSGSSIYALLVDYGTERRVTTDLFESATPFDHDPEWQPRPRR